MRGVGVIVLCLVAATLSKPDPQTFQDSPLGLSVSVGQPVGGGLLNPLVGQPQPVGGGLLNPLVGLGGLLGSLLGRSDLSTADLEKANLDLGRLLVRRPVHNRVRVVRPNPVGGGLLGPLVGLGLLGSLLGRSDLTTADLENANLDNEYEQDGLGRILVRRPVYKRVRVVRPRPGIFGGYRRPSAGGLLGNLLGLGLGASLLGGLLGRSDLPIADLERAYSEDEVEAIIAREVDAAVEAGKDLDRNGDGMVDRNEFHWTFPELDLYEEFGKLDTDNSGFIEQDELVDDSTLEFARGGVTDVYDCDVGAGERFINGHCYFNGRKCWKTPTGKICS